jgi:hypothetical protein
MDCTPPPRARSQRGLWHSGKASAEDNALAQKFFQQAVDLDPSFAGGYKGLSRAQGQAADVIHGCLLRVQMCRVGRNHDVSSRKGERGGFVA